MEVLYQQYVDAGDSRIDVFAQILSVIVITQLAGDCKCQDSRFDMGENYIPRENLEGKNASYFYKVSIFTCVAYQHNKVTNFCRKLPTFS